MKQLWSWRDNLQRAGQGQDFPLYDERVAKLHKEEWNNEKVIIPKPSITIIIDYPFSTVANIRVHSKYGFTLRRLMKVIQTTYKHFYRNEEKYGIWVYGIEGLAIERICLNNKGEVFLQVVTQEVSLPHFP